MRVPILMPQLGESIAEATIKAINVKQGDSVTADQDIIEVETEKAVMEVTAPCEGCVAEISAKVNISYPVGTVLGYLDISNEEAQRMGNAQEGQ
jgi:pyruvate/2-oxoglutarate dehydrogenase complex dihydrolipoamide acyltransferase (E2) component